MIGEKLPLADIAACFSAATIHDLSASTCSARLAQIAEHFGKPNCLVRDWFDDLYSRLATEYRCEYVYKNTLVNKLLLGRYSPLTSAMLFELRCDDRIADAVLLNGTSHAFEIKTDFDSLDRLSKQLEAYRSMFEYIHVVCSQTNVGQIEAELPGWAGIMVLTRNLSLSVRREPISQVGQISAKAIFPTFRKPEYLAAVGQEFGDVDGLPTGEAYDVCLGRFATLPSQKAHQHMINQLKGRSAHLAKKDAVNLVPRSLMAAFFRSDLPSSRWCRLSETLNLKLAKFLG